MSEYSIGVDLGSTRILAGVIDIKTGKVIDFAKKLIKDDRGKDAIMQKTIETIEKVICMAQIPLTQIVSIGVGAAGQVDRENGILISAPNLDCYDVDIRNILFSRFKKPIYVGNDIETATLGELKFGAGVGYDNFVCVFAGTGIGSGVVHDGRIYRGFTGTAGEVGHIVVASGGRQCSCGANGCLEAYASRSAIEKKILAEIKRGQNSTITKHLFDHERIHSMYIKQSIEEGDFVVKNAVNEAAEYLSSGLSTVINFFNPQLIILGGSLIANVDYLYDETVAQIKTKALPTPANNVKITKPALHEFAGIIGAALLKYEYEAA